ncbi:MAG: HAMP domain-containing sensor histidine kinase [Pseudomonadota bacterium]
MKLNSLALRLFATAAVWTAVVLPIAGILIYSIYRDETRTDFDSRLKTFLYILLADSTASGENVPSRPTNVGEALFEITDSGWYWQIMPVQQSKAPLLVSGSLATSRLQLADAKSLEPDAEGIRWRNGAAPNGKPIRIAEIQYQIGSGTNGPLYAFVVAGPLDWLYARENSFRTLLTVALAVVGLGLLGMTFLQIRFGLAPLARIERGLSDIRSGRAKELEGDLPSEIEPLQTELNALIASNQSVIERARTQVGNLAHALKTPLAVITNEASSSQAPFVQKVKEQAEVMRRQISHYLDRARVAARVDTVSGVTDVEPVVAALSRVLERIYEEQGVRIDADVPIELKFQGEKQDLEEMLGNLMDNGCKWADGRLRVRVFDATTTKDERARSSKVPTQFRLEIEDDGPGLTSEQMQQILGRGVRLDESKPGSGLGLSIVSDLAELYQGRFELCDGELGGLKAVLTLPRA